MKLTFKQINIWLEPLGDLFVLFLDIHVKMICGKKRDNLEKKKIYVLSNA